VDEHAEGRRRRGLVLAAVVLAVGVPVTATTWLSERNVDQQAGEMAEDLRRAGRQVGDVSGLAADELGSSWDGSGEPLDDVLGHGEAFAGAIVGTTGISLAYETSWGLARRCVHLLLRDGAPVLTEITDSASCRPLDVE
jgi:hypothetical protein